MAGRALAEGLWGPRPEAMTSLRMASAMASAKVGRNRKGTALPGRFDALHRVPCPTLVGTDAGQMLDGCWTDAVQGPRAPCPRPAQSRIPHQGVLTLPATLPIWGPDMPRAGGRVLRFIVSFIGGLFTLVTMGVLFSALTVGGIFYMYASDLPSHERLAQYAPPTISRIYSREGRIIDEFAQERRLFVPIEDIPQIVN